MTRCAVVIFEVIVACPYCHTSLEPRRLVLMYGIIVPYEVWCIIASICCVIVCLLMQLDSISGVGVRAMCAALSVGTTWTSTGY
jgi:hypothetical protein